MAVAAVVGVVVNVVARVVVGVVVVGMVIGVAAACPPSSPRRSFTLTPASPSSPRPPPPLPAASTRHRLGSGCATAPSPNWIQLAHDYNAGSAIGDRTLESIKARFKRLRDKGRLGPYRPYVPGAAGAGMGLFVGAPGALGAPVPAPPGKGSALDLMAAAAASAGDADGAAAILAMAASRSQKNKKPKPPLPPGPPPASAFLRDVAIAPRKKTDRSKARTKTTVKREKKKVDPFEQSSVQQDREER